MKKKGRRVSFSLPGEEQESKSLERVDVEIEDNVSGDSDIESIPDKLQSPEQPKPELAVSNQVRKRRRSNSSTPEDTSSTDNAEEDQDESASDSEASESDESQDSDSSEDEEEEQIDEEQEDDDEPDKKAPKALHSFSEMSLDPRLERGIERMGWKRPTAVQSAVLPAALASRDVLVSAPTGSGKTAAYAIPLVQHICRSASGATSSGIQAVVLVPTRELVHQVTTVLKALCKYIDGIRISGLTGPAGKSKKKHSLARETADVLVGTPSAVVAGASADESNPLRDVSFVVVDEADLLLSYGYERDAKSVLLKIPQLAQALLFSATLDVDGMDDFRKSILRRPLTVKITKDDDAQETELSGAMHYFARLKNHKDRYLVAYAMLRLNVISGKIVIFVNHIGAAFRLKLFLDQFKIKSAVLNSELPANSRIHCVEQFNAGVFDILLATDELKGSEKASEKMKGSQKNGKKRKRVEKDAEFGLSRGVDFKDVAAVLNFDLPEADTSYTHRAGRTARAGKPGTVLSLACTDKEENAIAEMGNETGAHIRPLAFRMDQIEAFRYRVESSLRLVTDSAVHGARLADVRREMVNSETLKDFFESNPQDLDALQHSLSLAKNIPEHLAHVPSYLLPPDLRGKVASETNGSLFKVKRNQANRKRNGKRDDPLRSFSAKGPIGSSRQRYRGKHGIKTKSKADPGRTMKKKRRRF